MQNSHRRQIGGHASGRSAYWALAKLQAPPPRTPGSAGRPGLACSLPGLGRFPRQMRATFPPESRPQPPTLRDGDSAELAAAYAHSADLPSASAPAYRRFRVTGDAEPPGLAHQSIIAVRVVKTFAKTAKYLYNANKKCSSCQ